MTPVRAAALATLPDTEARAVRGVLTDIDDTLTAEGAIVPEALAALAELRAAGLPVIAVTGRPKGWSEPFARDWPIDAIVAENGAVALFRDDARTAIGSADDAKTLPHDGAHGLPASVVGSDPGASFHGHARSHEDPRCAEDDITMRVVPHAQVWVIG